MEIHHIDFLKKIKEENKEIMDIIKNPDKYTDYCEWKCKKCGKINIFKFNVKFYKNQPKCRCVNCNSQTNKNKYTIDEVRKVFEERGYELIQNEYINCKEKMKYYCPICKNYHYMSFDNMKRGKGCPTCANSKQKLKKNEMIAIIEEKGFQVMKIEETKNKYNQWCRTVFLKCKHGHEFSYIWKTAKNRESLQCKVCNNLAAFTGGKTKEEIKKEVIKYINENNLNVEYIDSYKKTKNNRTFIYLKLKCNKHGEYTVLKSSFYKKAECKFCSYEKISFSIEEIKNKIRNIFSNEYLYVDNEYKNSKTKHKIKHNLCGRTFFTTMESFLGGNKTCPYCNNGKSNGEKYFKNYLNENNLNYQPEFIFKDCKYINSLPFDFAIFDKDGSLKFLCEIDGNLHRKYIKEIHKTEERFKEVLIRDSIKTQYCIDKNIKLYRIYYNTILDIKKWIENNQYLLKDLKGDKNE